ncbi:mitochondrial putative amino-acid acetyltransferase [Dioszegia hungarica]|uniref:Amino-acid acetyltransferase, mitochondrial n=1 Tax=Dioszegia hungarica TaxID=4972 RepID=A0AA38LRY6_9TREE|nr:mitochondrial putative amino-acid acetyltransferase [Dioszegia hungarica]KAI9635082.1 mitochondrial putative amino-acid acetyltransferase [Dioszegia hungarica]
MCVYDRSHCCCKADVKEFILSILRSSPSMRDSRNYLSSFGRPTAPPFPNPSEQLSGATPALSLPPQPGTDPTPATDASNPQPENPLVASLLDPIVRHPALVKIQGPFTDLQLNSICQGMAHLQKLGLVSVIVLDRDDLPATEPADTAAAQRQKKMVLRDLEKVVASLGRLGAGARPVLSTVARIAGKSGEGDSGGERVEGEVFVEEEGLDHVRRAVTEGEIPVLLPVALDSGCRTRRVGADAVLKALAESMAAAPVGKGSGTGSSVVDLTPLRLLIINREGGIPSYARQGLPHLSINLASELSFIQDTYLPHWSESHPTALSNLRLSDACLAHMPRDASALLVSHRSPAAMIANLITNKPAHSASLPHALLVESEGRLTRDTPTLIRKGLPVRVLRSLDEVDRPALNRLLEKSFRRTLDQDAFYTRLETDMDFLIVIGDYAGAAIVTTEPDSTPEGICYLDKFAVLPSHQGDGTVDFLWVALRDETYGLGLLDAANPSEGSLSGQGRGRDLVWRSRADNPVNKWYAERSNGFITTPDGKWKMFWCDAEERLRERARQGGREFGGGWLSRMVEMEEEGRLARWEPVIGAIGSVWAK